MDRRAMALLGFAHLADDISQSFLPALLPLLVAERGLTYATAATLVFAQAVASSVIQPLIGALADRRPMPWLSAVGVFLAGSGVAAIGFLGPFPLLLLAALVSGVGVACFHPEAARFANYVAGDKKASGMRWFAIGGNSGFAIGPALAAAALATYGLHGTFVAAIPVSVMAALIFIELRRLRTFIPAHAHKRSGAGFDDWPSFVKLSLFVTVRSMAYLGAIAFIPLFFVHALGATPELGSLALTVYLTAGAFGTLAGGPIADRVGRKPVMLWSTVGNAVVIAAFAFAARPEWLWLDVALAGLAGFILVASQTAFIILGQEYLPNRLGTASGVTLGLAVSLGGMFTPVLGRIGDVAGIRWSVGTTALLSAIAVVVALTLPAHARRVQETPGNPSVASAS